MVEVCIIGAGPSGLLITANLLRYGLNCRLIDQSSSPSDKSKAIVVQPRTLELLNELGLADTCIAQGLKIDHFTGISEGKKIIDLSFKELDSPYPFLLSLEQNKLENILIEHLAALNFFVEREVELLNLTQDKPSVQMTLKNSRTSEIEKCSARWVIGCDGAHSTTRRQLGFDFEGLSFPQLFSLADVEMDWNQPHEGLIGHLEKTSAFFIAPLQEKNRYRFIFQLAASKVEQSSAEDQIDETSFTSLDKPILQHLLEITHQYVDPKAQIKNCFWTSNFSINSRMVKDYQNKNVFLVGDAAHIHSPVGGQGMNTGIQDGFNLAWKLALVSKQVTPLSLLESYHQERHSVGKQLLKATERATQFILTRSSFLLSLRNLLIPFITSLPFIRKKIISAISEITISYPPSPWIVEDASSNLKLKAGQRAPNAFFMQDSSIRSLYEQWKGSLYFQLLVIDTDNQFQQWDELIHLVEEKSKDYIVMHRVQSHHHHHKDPAILQDDKQQIKQRYGDFALYLIRPDRYIGFCCSLSDLNSFKNYLDLLFI